MANCTEIIVNFFCQLMPILKSQGGDLQNRLTPGQYLSGQSRCWDSRIPEFPIFFEVNSQFSGIQNIVNFSPNTVDFGHCRSPHSWDYWNLDSTFHSVLLLRFKKAFTKQGSHFTLTLEKSTLVSWKNWLTCRLSIPMRLEEIKKRGPGPKKEQNYGTKS